jgi:hypothetical protein
MLGFYSIVNLGKKKVYSYLMVKVTGKRIGNKIEL